MSAPIRFSLTFKGSPARVYAALTKGAHFKKMTGGAPASIGSTPGSKFSLFGGMITGRQLELVRNKRIVQVWRSEDWKKGEYSLVRFDLKPAGKGTRILFEHVGFPSKNRRHLVTGWRHHYWNGLKGMLK